jgi:hypothetical protein
MGKRKKPRGPARSKANSVEQFCLDLGIGRTNFYQLLKSDYPPRTLRIGSRRLVSESGTQYRDRLAVIQSAEGAQRNPQSEAS